MDIERIMEELRNDLWLEDFRHDLCDAGLPMSCTCIDPPAEVND